MTAPDAPPPTPLAMSLLGWAFTARSGAVVTGALAVLGAGLVAGEYAHPRDGLRLPFEGQPGFYAALGVGAIVAALVAVAGLRWLLVQNNPYPDEDDRDKVQDGDHP
jgi:hypothetical protein